VASRRDPIEFLETFGALARCLRALGTHSYGTVELSRTQARFLRHIGQHSRISQAALSRATATDPTLTGRTLQLLIERGWVRRKRSEEDRREYVLELGAAGQSARKRAEAIREQIAERIAAVLQEKDLEDFERIAKKLLAAFKDYAEGSDRS
jgi:DNA-binding MarR family transcriptional regulator